MHDLATLQRRFYELVTAGEGEIEPGLLGSSRRLDVYADAYVARLHDVLADDYPKLRAVLGSDEFRELATGYVRACPPTSFTIRDAGFGLSEYLASRDDLSAWSSDLARLERARVEVFDGADALSLSRDDLAALSVERFPELVLALIPASSIVSVRWSVDDLWSVIEDDLAREAPKADARAILVWRRDLRVVHRTLDSDEAALVARLPCPLAAVADTLGALGVDTPEQRLTELLGRWIDAGLLSRAHVLPE